MIGGLAFPELSPVKLITDIFRWLGDIASQPVRTVDLGEPGFLPERCGLIVADGYDAEILRPAATVPLAASRRKTETERLARAALRRQLGLIDPNLAAWGD